MSSIPKPFGLARKKKSFGISSVISAKPLCYARRHCTGGLDGELEWKVAAGRATVYTYSIVRQSYHPFFRNQVPYAVAWVDLEEGPRILSNIVGVEDPITEVTIGMPLEIEWEEHEDLCIPLFKPA